MHRGIAKSKAVTIRLPVRDIEGAQKLAERQGLDKDEANSFSTAGFLFVSGVMICLYWLCASLR